MLTKLQSRWGRKVALGSYPDWLSNYHRVRLVLDSDSQEQMEKAQAQLLDELPAGSVVALVTDPVSIATTEVYTLADNGRGGGRGWRKINSVNLIWETSALSQCVMKQDVKRQQTLIISTFPLSACPQTHSHLSSLSFVGVKTWVATELSCRYDKVKYNFCFTQFNIKTVA